MIGRNPVKPYYEDAEAMRVRRAEALAAFRESRVGAGGVNPSVVFLQGWDACLVALTHEVVDAAPEWKLPGWKAGPIV